MVRNLFFIVSVFCFVTACSDHAQKTVISDERKAIVAEIKRFRAAVLSKDGHRIADFFDFPIYSESLWDEIHWFDTTLQDQSTGTVQLIRKEFFLTEAKFIVSDFNRLFKYVNIDSIASKSAVYYEAMSAKKPCIDIYRISLISDDTVKFEFNTDSNPTYKLTKEDIENDFDQSALCEHMKWWVFGIKSGKLKFISIGGAG